MQVPPDTPTYDPRAKQKAEAKTARIPIKIVPAETLKKPVVAKAPVQTPTKPSVAKLVTVQAKVKPPVKPAAANANAKLAVVPPVAGKPVAVRPGAPVAPQ